MTWEVDKYFMIRTISQKKNEPEEVHDLKNHLGRRSDQLT